jgi:hypothetical protein
MKKFVYAVAAVLALAPLAAIGPASAAVQGPAAAQATCTGGWPVVTNSNYNDVGSLIGYWHISSSGIVTDSYGLTPAEFCMVTVWNGSAVAFREQGTSNCAAFIPAQNYVLMKGCDYSSANQQWEVDQGNIWYTVSSNAYETLQGLGGNTDLLMNSLGLNGEDWSYS